MSNRENGAVLIGIGFTIMTLGAFVMFDRALMIAGNFIAIGGLSILLRSRIFHLLKPDQLLGTSIFSVGILSLFMRHVILGFLLEFFGLIWIFKQSIPNIRASLFRLVFGRFWFVKKAN